MEVVRFWLAGTAGPIFLFSGPNSLFSLSPVPAGRTITLAEVSPLIDDPVQSSTPDSSPREVAAREVFEILVREHADMLTAYLRSLIGADPAVDDLFQQSMLVAWRRLADYDRERPFGPWLRGIAQRLVLEHRRRSSGRPRVIDPLVLVELDRRFDELSAQPGDTFRERAERLTLCLSKLPDAMRHAIEMIYARGLLIAVAATALGSRSEEHTF